MRRCRGGRRRDSRGGPSGRVPPGRADRRRARMADSGVRRRHQRPGDDQRARGRAAGGRETAGQHVHRRRAVRRRRRASTPEDDPIKPMAPYGQGKLAAEGYCELYTRLHGLSTVSLRYGNVYGPRQDVHGEAGVVAIFCGRPVEGRRHRIRGRGADPRLGRRGGRGPGQPAGGGLGDRRTGQHRPRTGDLGAGPARCASSSVNDGGHLAEPIFAPDRPGEVRRSCLDVSQAMRELGWEAKVDLRDGLHRILEGL